MSRRSGLHGLGPRQGTVVDREMEKLPRFLRLEALRRLLAIGRESKPLWWYPMWSLVAGLVVGILVARFVDIDAGPLAFLVYGGDPEAARSFVSLAASSVATITSLTLTITVVTLQLASSQYSPRLIEHYLSDRGTRAVISLFLLTFAFSVATLLNVRLAGDASDGRVPGPAISILIVLIIACLGALVFFVYRVTESIRVESILKRVRDRTIEAIEQREQEDPSGEQIDELPEPDPDGTVVRSRRTGFFVALDRDAIDDEDVPTGIEVWIVVSPGDFVTVDSPVAVVSGLDVDDPADVVERWLRFDTERWIETDYSYGVRSMLDVAVKALSPGINDPTTAVMALQRIAEVMSAAANSHPDRKLPIGEDAFIYLTVRSWRATLDDVLHQIALYGRQDVNVVTSVIRMLWALLWTQTDVDRTDEIRNAGELFRTLVDIDRPEPDQRVIDHEFSVLEDGLEGILASEFYRGDGRLESADAMGAGR